VNEHRQDPPPKFDQEIDVRHIVEIGIWLAAMTILALLISWGYYHLLSHGEKKLDLEPSPVVEANRPQVPQGPRLLATPENALKAYRSLEQERLESWGWEDRGAGIAHVPIERALDAVAASGELPEFAPAAPEGARP
jgi:hypothetical protein